jgi:phosphoglycolate phosphatase-like HAD superfamily hydrolase
VPQTVIVFDIDGTLIETNDLTLAIINDIFDKKYNIPNIKHLIPRHGITDSYLIDYLLRYRCPEQQFHMREQIIHIFIDDVKKKIAGHIKIKENAVKVLSSLSKNFTLCSVTGNFYNIAEMKLREVNLREFFTYLICCDNFSTKDEMFIELKKKFPIETSYVYVCDTLQDVQISNRNAIKAILLVSNDRTETNVPRYTPSIVIMNLEELIDLLIK